MASPRKPADESTKAFIIAISGPSCSGKTTLSRLLRDTLAPIPPSTQAASTCTIIHQDDFYLSDAAIPLVQTAAGSALQDWDCREAIDFSALERMLAHLRRTGRVVPGFDSKEDTNAVGRVDVDYDAIASAQAALRRSVQRLRPAGGEGGARQIVIVDGFLLFAQGLESLMAAFDVRLLLTVGHETVKRRREARKGYVTLEGFWEDPPGYVDDIVWPNYVKDHAFLFKDGNVEGSTDGEQLGRLGIHERPQSAREDMTECFIWATQLIASQLDHLTTR